MVKLTLSLTFDLGYTKVYVHQIEGGTADQAFGSWVERMDIAGQIFYWTLSVPDAKVRMAGIETFDWGRPNSFDREYRETHMEGPYGVWCYDEAPGYDHRGGYFVSSHEIDRSAKATVRALIYSWAAGGPNERRG